MKPDQPNSDNESVSVQRPWTAIFTGGILVLLGIGASIYSFIALTWTAESKSEVIYIEPSTASTPSTQNQSEAEYLDSDRPIRTSTTRRRTTPREVRRPSQTATTLSQEKRNSSKTTNSGAETTSDDDAGQENTEADENDEEQNEGEPSESTSDQTVPSSIESVD